MSLPSPTDQPPDAQHLTFVLTNHQKYGIVERAMYHFDAMSPSILPGSSSFEDEGENEEIHNDVENGSRFDGIETGTRIESSYCGVVKLLECVPVLPQNTGSAVQMQQKVKQQQRKALRRSVNDFNKLAEVSSPIVLLSFSRICRQDPRISKTILRACRHHELHHSQARSHIWT